MYTREATGEISRRLHDAVARLEKDIAMIEIWAGALTGFMQPVPDYEPCDDNLLPSGRKREEKHA